MSGRMNDIRRIGSVSIRDRVNRSWQHVGLYANEDGELTVPPYDRGLRCNGCLGAFNSGAMWQDVELFGDNLMLVPSLNDIWLRAVTTASQVKKLLGVA